MNKLSFIFILLIFSLPLFGEETVYGSTDLTTTGNVGGKNASFTGDVSIGGSLSTSSISGSVVADSIDLDYAKINFAHVEDSIQITEYGVITSSTFSLGKDSYFIIADGGMGGISIEGSGDLIVARGVIHCNEGGITLGAGNPIIKEIKSIGTHKAMITDDDDTVWFAPDTTGF